MERHPATCSWKCGNLCASAPSSAPGSLGDVVLASLSRRDVLKAGLASLVVVAGRGLAAERGLGFTPIAPSTEDRLIVPEGYAHDVVLRWGDPLARGVRRFDISDWSARDQALAFGYNCDFTTHLNLPWGGGDPSRGLLVVNHEYTNPELMFPGYTEGSATREQVEVDVAAHGLSVVEVRRDREGRVTYAYDSGFNRRVTGDTPMELTGPAAGHPLLRTHADPTGTRVLGMLNNCSGGVTPWGTALSCEENFHQYFAGAGSLPDGAVARMHARYGIPKGRTARGWERFYGRFDVSLEPNEAFRFGWVVEIDPYDPLAMPKKRTALGRFLHEAAATALAADGRAVVYMGDDTAFEHIYKFVSRGASGADRRSCSGLLDEGTLFVARLDADGTGTWLPLVHGEGPLTEANGFASQADVLLNTRGAADLLGATKMDRPEDIERNPVTGAVYAVMTNNAKRAGSQVDGANPRAANRCGHVVEILEEGNDAAARRFRWSLFLVCGDPGDPSTYFAGFPKGKVSPISTPDNVAFDRAGNLWIATDGQRGSIGNNDGIFVVPTAGPERGRVRQFLSAPEGAEVCGPAFTSDGRTFFAAIQHPGEGGTVEKPSSRWPDGAGAPRPSVVAIRREDGDAIGA
ncbi:MAG TPA: PhoX family phosphatase [Planctomycetota bacterium]|nr:PhoX family phosphatase [Planctomycetota bacterium]